MACFRFCERLFLLFFRFCSIIFRRMYSVHYCCFLSGKNLILLFTRESSVSFLFFYFSICLNFLSNSLRSFFNSSMLLFGVGQNLRPSKLIWSLFNLCVDKFIILCLTFVLFFILFFFPPFCMV